MAVDVCSEVSSLVVSPRISFSHDLREAADPVECRNIIRTDALLLESIDFNFCISQSFSKEQEHLSSADELFADGKILPAEVKKSSSSAAAVSVDVKADKKDAIFEENDLRSKPISPRFRRDTKTEPPLNFETKKKSLKEFLSLNLDSDAEEDQKKPAAPPPPPPPKPFWQFRRSSSLNFETCRSNSTLIRSLHFLSRSNSTGSAPNPKPKVMMQKQNSQKDQGSSSAKRTNHHHPLLHPSNSSSYRSPSRKNYGNGNGVRISPVLNIPHACISKGSVSLFGLGSLFCNAKSKKKKKFN